MSSIQSRSADFATLDQRAASGGRLSIVFLGGSLTWGAQSTDPQNTSYRARTGQKFEAHYPNAHFHFWDAAIGGTGSELAAFRLERDVLAHKPDLVFLEFTINDNPYVDPDPTRLASYESLVRRLVQAHVAVEQVILPAKVDYNSKPPARPLDPLHKEIAHAYGLPIADCVEYVREVIKSGKETPDTLWDAVPDGTHPGDKGYALYADCAFATYLKAVSDGAKNILPEKMLHADTFMTVNRWRIADAPLPEGWIIKNPSRLGIAYDFYCSRWMGTEAAAERGEKSTDPAPAPLDLKVKGADIYVFGEIGPKSGNYKLSVDGGPDKEMITSKTPLTGNMRYWETLALNLDPKVEHRIKITPDLQPGQELRIESICVAGAPAEVKE